MAEQKYSIDANCISVNYEKNCRSLTSLWQNAAQENLLLLKAIKSFPLQLFLGVGCFSGLFWRIETNRQRAKTSPVITPA